LVVPFRVKVGGTRPTSDTCAPLMGSPVADVTLPATTPPRSMAIVTFSTLSVAASLTGPSDRRTHREESGHEAER
jgi:hypothetical protein